MDALIVFKLARSLNAFPRRCHLDQNPLLLDANRLVECNERSSFLLGGLLVEGEARVNLGGDATRNDLQDLGAKLDELRRRRSTSEKLRYVHTHETIHSSVHLIIDSSSLVFAIGYGIVNKPRVSGLIRGLEYQRRVGSGILGLVDVDSCQRRQLSAPGALLLSIGSATHSRNRLCLQRQRYQSA